jgi:YVTN family beta-propeller protein
MKASAAKRSSRFSRAACVHDPDVDLNAYYVLALNEESNISVIDPLLGFGASKLLTLVMLKSPGEDWAQKNSDEKLFVSMPGANQIAVVDTSTWKVVTNIDAGLKPSRVRLQPDQRYLWVGNDAAAPDKPSGVTVIDTATLKVVAQLATGNGHHEIDFSSDNRFAFVTNETDGTLSVIDIQKLAKLKDLKTGTAATSVAFSTIGNALYLANETDGSIAVVDVRSQQIAYAYSNEAGHSQRALCAGRPLGLCAKRERERRLRFRRFDKPPGAHDQRRQRTRSRLRSRMSSRMCARPVRLKSAWSDSAR